MRIKANVLTDELLNNLLKDSNITYKACFSICQFLKKLGLAKVDVTESPKNFKEVNFTFYHTALLKKILRNSQANEVGDDNDNNDDDNNNDNDNDNNNNNNNNNNENEGRTTKSRKRASYYGKM